MKVFEDSTLFKEGVSKLFLDAKDLQDGPGAMAVNAVSDASEPIPMCHDLFAGFPCQDVSRLNPDSPKNRQVIRDRALRTGSVFNHVVEYFDKAQKGPAASPYMSLILENVLGLLERPPGTNPETGTPWRSNLEYCALSCRKSGLRYQAAVVRHMSAIKHHPESSTVSSHMSRVTCRCVAVQLLS